MHSISTTSEAFRWAKPKQTEAIKWSVTCLHSKGNHKVWYVATKGTGICEVTFTSAKMKNMKEFSKGGKQTEARVEVVSVSALSETRGRRLDPTPIPREYFTLPKSLHISKTHPKQKFFEERCQPSIPLTCLPFRRKFLGSMSSKNKSAIIVK